MSNHDTDGTIQVKVEFRNHEPIQRAFSISDAVDDVRKWAIDTYRGQIADATSLYVLRQIDPKTGQAGNPVEANFVALKDLTNDEVNVLEFMLDHEKDTAGKLM